MSGRTYVPAFVREADVVLRQLTRARDRRLEQVCLAAAALKHNAAWRTLGYANVNNFALETFERSGQWFREHATLGAVMRERPELSDALSGRDGGRPLGRVVALRIARNATHESTICWIAKARTLSTQDFLTYMREAKERAATAVTEIPGTEDAKCTDGTQSSKTTMQPDVSEASEGSTSDAGALAVRSAISDDDVPRRHVPFRLPAPVRVAFEETRDLHRAVSGGESDLNAFIEAVSAECAAAGLAPESPEVPPEFRRQVLRRQRASRRSMGARIRPFGAAASNFSGSVEDADEFAGAAHRPARAHSPALRAARDVLERLASAQRVLSRVTDVEAVQVRCNSAHETIRQLRALVRGLRAFVTFEDEIERHIGALLAELDDDCGLSSLGFDSAVDYAVEHLGMSATNARMRVQTERALRQLPVVREAYESGAIGQRAAFLSRKSLQAPSAELQSAYVARAQSVSVRRLQDESHMMQREHLLNTTATYCDTVRDLRRGRRPESGAKREDLPSDDEWQASMERLPGHTWSRIVDLGLRTLDLCALRHGNREPTTALDGILHLNLEQSTAEWFLGLVESVRQGLMRGAAEPQQISRPSADARECPALRIARTLSTQALPSWVALLAMLEECGATWDDVRTMPRRPEDPVHNRDGWRCAAPGCTSRRNLHTHHIVYRSHLGGEELSNRITLCVFHHQRGEHGDFLQVRGRAPLELVWRLGHRDLDSWFVNDRKLSRKSDRRLSRRSDRRLPRKTVPAPPRIHPASAVRRGTPA